MLLCFTTLTVVFSLSINSFSLLPSDAFINKEGIFMAEASPFPGPIVFKSSVQSVAPESLL